MEDKLIPGHAVPLIPARAVLVLAPHADDEVFGCGGALAGHAAAACPVTVIVVSDGAYAAADAGARAARIAVREAESAAAAAVLGYPAPQFWQLPDRGVVYGEDLISRIQTAIAAAAADLVYAPALSEMHPDHRALAMAAVEAVRRCAAERPGLRLAMYEVGVPLAPNVLLDITAQIEQKAAAMRCFASQLAVQAYDAHIAALNRYRTYTLPATVQAAEAFHVVDAAALANDPLGLFASEYSRQARLGLALDAGRDLPLVSVIIRSMDRELLSDALDSLALQSYPHLEVLLVNAKGGKHSDPGPRCGRFPLRLINAEGARLDRAAAANAGLAAAAGELVAFLDDDDTVDADHYQQLVSAQRAAGSDSVVYAGVRCMDRADAERKVISVFAEEFAWVKLLAGNFIPIHAPLFPRRYYNDGLRFDESLQCYEDWDFWLQLAQVARFVLSPRVTATYFLSGTSGVGIGQADPARMQQAAVILHTKWHGRIGGAELSAIGELYRLRNSECQQARDQSRWHEREMQRLQAENQQLHGSAEQWQALAELWQAEAEKRQAIMHGLLHSSSWRLTAPLRAVLGFLAKRGRN